MKNNGFIHLGTLIIIGIAIVIAMILNPYLFPNSWLREKINEIIVPEVQQTIIDGAENINLKNNSEN